MCSVSSLFAIVVVHKAGDAPRQQVVVVVVVSLYRPVPLFRWSPSQVKLKCVGKMGVTVRYQMSDVRMSTIPL